MTAVITQTFIPGPRLIDGTDLNNLVAQANNGFQGVYTTLQVGTLAVSGLATLSTTQIGSLTVTSLGNSTTATVNGTALTSCQVGTVTASSVVLFGLKTAGGTVGTPTMATAFEPSTGKFCIKSAASDTSTYNVTVLG